MGLIEQGIVSNRQPNFSITSLFLYKFIQNYQHFSFNNKIFSFRVLWCSFLIYATGKIKWLIQDQTLINDLC